MKKVREILIKNCTLWVRRFDKFHLGIISQRTTLFNSEVSETDIDRWILGICFADILINLND